MADKGKPKIEGFKYDKRGNPTHFGYQRPGEEEIFYVPIEEPQDTAEYLQEKVGWGFDYASIKAIREQLAKGK